MGIPIKKSQLEGIYRLISSTIEISQSEWEYYSPMFEVRSIKKKEMLLREGEICQSVFFVNKGLLRVYFNDNHGEELTFYFTQENDLASDYGSLLQQSPSSYNIQAMEDTEVVVWSVQMIQDGFQHLRFADKLGRILIEKYFILFSQKIQSLYTKKPLERYNEMNQLFPSLLSRVPQHYIASYLNISSVHLSRLKSKSWKK
jgi:CRP-like cAMP-binding protein